METTTKRRLFLLGAILVSLGAVGAVSMGNIGENLVYYWDPSQLVAAGDDANGATVRLGGLVQEGSLVWSEEENVLRFVVTDDEAEVNVRSTGAPPQMFREGIGVVVEGTLDPSGTFVSSRLMVKHSNEYRAPQDGVAPEELYETVENL